MCHESCKAFITRNLIQEEVCGKRVLEIGSFNINGTVRPGIEAFKCADYIGIDYRQGVGVDIVCDAENIIDMFGKNTFDVVISTSFLEHVENWKKVISNIKNVVKDGGIMLHTTVSKGYGFHEYPHDYWRYEIDDMRHIFSDCEILVLEKDTQIPGVFIKARKKAGWKELDLSKYELSKP